MQRDYARLVNLAVDLRSDVSSPDRHEAEALYRNAIEEFVASLLAERGTEDRAVGSVERDMDEIAALSDHEIRSTLDKVRYDIVSEIQEKAGPTASQLAWRTRLVGIAGLLGVAIVASVYFGIRQYSAVPIKDPLESRAGLQQRADAFIKVTRYGRWVGGERSRRAIFKKIVLWPIEPTAPEIKGAQEFAGATLFVASELGRSQTACNIPPAQGEFVSQPEIDLVNSVAERVRDKATVWRDPAPNTVIDIIRAIHPC